ncbi:MAG: hypothetical protein KF696_00375 [Planctomycetes bacterium]|nr:hypothetical protein [Planctomycetota bacterium]MCW8134606.1 hypothetical protein [Planctomycetota bacterium]
METNTTAPLLSLIEGDPFRSLGAKFHFGPVPAAFLVLCASWGVTAILAVYEGLHRSDNVRENLFLDLAAFGQFWLCLPLVLFAALPLDRHIRNAGNHLRVSGLLTPRQHTALDADFAALAKFRASVWPTVGLMILAVLLSVSWYLGEWSSGVSTWYQPIRDGHKRVSYPGLWAVCVAVPTLNFVVLRMAFRLLLWSWFLKRVSQQKLALDASHPDQSGGLAFIGRVQAKFGVLIFVVGFMVMTTIAYKLYMDGASFGEFAVWGPALGFVILAPLTFMLPLLVFSPQLFATKRTASLRFDADALSYLAEPKRAQLEHGSYCDFLEKYRTAQKMHLIPFDLVTAARLIATAVAPMAPLLPKLLSFLGINTSFPFHSTM